MGGELRMRHIREAIGVSAARKRKLGYFLTVKLYLPGGKAKYAVRIVGADIVGLVGYIVAGGIDGSRWQPFAADAASVGHGYGACDMEKSADLPPFAPIALGIFCGVCRADEARGRRNRKGNRTLRALHRISVRFRMYSSRLCKDSDQSPTLTLPCQD